MKTLILLLACLLLVTSSQAASRQIGQAEQITEQIKWQLKSQEDRLKDIEELISQERQYVEDWYARRLADIQQSAEEQARKFNLYYKMLWTEFIKMNNQVPYANGYLSNTVRLFYSPTLHIPDERDAKWDEMRQDMMDSYFLRTARDFLIDKNFINLLTEITNSKYQDIHIRIEARTLLNIVKRFESELTRLQDLKNAKLAALEQQEKYLKEDVFRVMREIEVQPETSELAMVSAICCDEEQAFCMVEGVDGLLEPGDTINNAAIQNVKVVKIDKDKVKFEKDGRRWEQQVGGRPKPYWK